MPHERKRLVAFSAVGLVAVLALVWVGKAVLSRSAPSLRPVTVRLDWTLGSEHSFFYLGIKNGEYSSRGMAPQILAGEGSTVSAKLVASGDVDFALCSGDSALIARTQGLPLVVLAVLYPKTPASIYSLRENQITRPVDLYGKKYGATLKSTTYQQFIALANVLHLDRTKIQIMPSSGRVQELLSGLIDAQGGYTYLQPVQLEVTGHPVNEIRMVDHGVNVYSMSLICSTRMIQQRRDLVKDFTQVTLKAFARMLAEPDAAFQSFVSARPDCDQKFERAKLEKLIRFLSESPASPLGLQSAEGWEATQRFLLDQQIIQKQIGLGGFFTNEFIK